MNGTPIELIPRSWKVVTGDTFSLDGFLRELGAIQDNVGLWWVAPERLAEAEALTEEGSVRVIRRRRLARAKGCLHCGTPFDAFQLRGLRGSPGRNAVCRNCGTETSWVAYWMLTDSPLPAQSVPPPELGST